MMEHDLSRDRVRQLDGHRYGTCGHSVAICTRTRRKRLRFKLILYGCTVCYVGSTFRSNMFQSVVLLHLHTDQVGLELWWFVDSAAGNIISDNGFRFALRSIASEITTRKGKFASSSGINPQAQVMILVLDF